MRIPFAVEILAGTAIAFHAMAASSEGSFADTVHFADAAQTRITIGQAIVIAEQHAGGEAIEAELDRNAGHLTYDIDVETAYGDIEVIVDTKTGAVLDMSPDD